MPQVWVDPLVYREIARLPGHMRQRIRQAIAALSDTPRPNNAKQLHVQGIEPEVWRLRIDQWRVVYTLDTLQELIIVWAVRKRPPYNYDDLLNLLESLKQE
jgi:mRNA interferase RelE/StbE